MPSHDPGQRIEDLRDRIETSEDLSDTDRDRLLEFSDEIYLLSSKFSDYRHEKLLRHNTIIAENEGGLDDALESKTAAKAIVRWINQRYDNYETNRDYRIAFRVFGKLIAGVDGDPPESISWVPSGTPSSYDPSPEPRKMLDWDDDVRPMISECHNNRDRALIALAFDAGPRGGELKNLTVGDITDGEHGLRLTLDGKMGRRTITLIPSTPWVNRWLADHPADDDPDAPLWSNLHSTDDISDRAFYNILERAADRVDVTKPVTPTNYRKSSASFLASQGMSQAMLEDHHGWVRGSGVASRYVSVFAEAASDELARIHGREVEREDDEPIGPVDCPRCGEQTPRDQDFCVWCNQAIDAEAASKANDLDDEIVDEAVEAAADEGRDVTPDDILEVREKLQEDPILRQLLLE